MEVAIKEGCSAEVELTVSADWDDVRDDYSGLLKKYAKLPVKGFRQGGAPQAIVEKMFRKEIQVDMIYLCSHRLCRKALNGNKLMDGFPVSVSDVEMIRHKRFGFKAKFYRMPGFDLPDYAQLGIVSESHEEKLTEVSEKLLGRTCFEVHDDFIEREMDFSSPEEGISEELRKENAKNRVKLMMILKRIAEADNIEADGQDVDDRIKKIAEENDVTVSELKNYLLETGGLARLRDLLLSEYVLNYIIEINS